MNKNIYRLGEIEIELDYLINYRARGVYAESQRIKRIDALKIEKRQILAYM